MRRFIWSEGAIVARLDALDLAALRAVPGLLSGVGDVGVDPAAARLQPAVYRDDPERSAEFLRLAADIVDDGRREDLEAFMAGYQRIAEGGGLSPSEAESWARALTTARLVLGARMGIEEDGWEEDPDADFNETHLVVLHVLGRVQAALVGALSAGL